MKKDRSIAKLITSLAIAFIISLLLTGCARTIATFLGTDPGERVGMKVGLNRIMTTRDGVELATDVYEPAGEGPWPVVVTRLPYGSDNALFKNLGKLFVRNGYVFVVQDTRGSKDSDGAWFPLIWEYEDGHDTIEWVSEQSWCNGKIGMWGGSYFGYTQLAAAPDNPKITCMTPFVTSGNMHKVIFRGGARELLTTEGWITGERNAQLEKTGEKEKLKTDFSGGFYNDPIRDAKALDYDALRSDPDMINAGPEEFLIHPGDVEDMPPLNYSRYYDKVSAPSLLIAGWYDMFLGPQLDDFVKFRSEGRGDARKTRLIVGPWVHGLFLSKFEESPFAGFQVFGSSFMDWLDYWLKGVENGAADEAPVKIFVMGENVWRDENEWPLARTRFTRYYLHGQGDAHLPNGSGSLGKEAPTGHEPEDRYFYDPMDPVETAGGNFLGAGGYQPGVKDQTGLAKRPDVLVYRTPPLLKNLEVTGPITLHLFASSSARDTDFTAKLLDLGPTGKARLLQTGIVRARYRESLKNPSAIEPDEIYEYTIDMWATSNLFKKGHRVALWVSSSDFPQFDRNTNAAGEGGPDNVVIARQKIFHDADHPSALVLPVIPR